MPSLKKPKDTLRYQFRKHGISLVNRELTLPSGLKTKLDVIIHPGAVLIVPFLTRNQVVILRQYRGAVEKYLYEFPAGTLDEGENAATCAHRELKEEASYAAARVRKMGSIFPVPAYSTEEIFIYKAEGLTPHKEEGDEDEVLTPVVMTIAQVRKLFYSGQIKDAKTITALAFCKII